MKSAKPKTPKLVQKRKKKVAKTVQKTNVFKKTKKKRKERVDKKINESAIRDAFVAILVEKKGRPPTAAEIAKRVGVAHKTVSRHVANLKFEPKKSIWRLMTPDVYTGMLSAARKGSSRCISLWLQVFEDWAPRRDITSGGKVIKGMVSGHDTTEGEAFDAYMTELHEDRL